MTTAMEDVREKVALGTYVAREARRDAGDRLLRLIAQPDFEEKIARELHDASEAYDAKRGWPTVAAWDDITQVDRDDWLREARTIADFLARSAVGGSDV